MAANRQPTDTASSRLAIDPCHPPNSRPGSLPFTPSIGLRAPPVYYPTAFLSRVFAAAVGFAKHRGEAADDFDRGEGIRLGVFAEDEAFIDALAVAAHDTLTVLDPDRQPERVLLFEQYAWLGLQHLQRACYDARPEHPVEGILVLLDELARPVSEALPGLEDMF